MDSTKFKAGIRINSKNWVLYCNCGHVTNGIFSTCEKCGNKNFFTLRSYEADNKCKMGAFIIEDIAVGYLKISRHNFTGQVLNDKFEILRTNMKQTFEIDFIKGIIKTYKNDKIVIDTVDLDKEAHTLVTPEDTYTFAVTYAFKAISKFFTFGQRMGRGYLSESLNKASNLNDFDYDLIDRSKFFLKSVESKMGGIVSHSESDGLFYKKVFEKINNPDSKKALHLFERFLNAKYSIDLGTFTFYDSINNALLLNPEIKPELPLHKVLGLSKKSIKLLISKKLSIKSQLFILGNDIAENKIKMSTVDKILNKAYECDSLEDILFQIRELSEFIEKYHYSPERLVIYLSEELPMYQGILKPNVGFVQLKDYVNMSVEMGYQYEKYPKSLKREHDVKMVNYTVYSEKKENKEFVERVHKYKQFEYSNEEYAIITPETPKDLVEEGGKLHHCIASYTNRVASGQSLILFVRLKENIEKPLISVELSSDYRLVQARGLYNKIPEGKLKDFIYKEWMVHVRREVDILKSKSTKIHVIENFQ